MNLVVPTFAENVYDPGIPLSLYAQHIQVDERNFFGLHFDGQPDFACRTIWTKEQRDMIAFYLKEAQREIEDETVFPVVPTWIGVGAYGDEQAIITPTLFTQWRKIIEVGQQTIESIQDGVVLSHATDPATTAVVNVGLDFDVDELVVYHPGSDVVIHPSAIDYDDATGNLIVEIPRARLITLDNLVNPEDGWDYATVPGVFEEEVDLSRVYADPDRAVEFIRRETCECSSETDWSCLFVRYAEMGAVEIKIADIRCSCPEVKRANLYYKAGLDPVTERAIASVIKLAHAKMPEEPCGCSVAKRLWSRDRFVPEQVTRERFNCPFGPSNGAWEAWGWVQSMATKRMFVI